MAISQTTAVWETVAASPSSTACFNVPRTATIKAAIIVFEWPGSRPCSAPSSIALGINSQALPCCRREVKSFISGSLPKVRLSYSPPVVKYYPPVDKAANKKDHGMLAGVADHAGR